MPKKRKCKRQKDERKSLFRKIKIVKAKSESGLSDSSESRSKHTLGPEIRSNVKDLYNNKCIKCKGKGKKKNRITIHHIIRVSDGGGDEINNLCTLCQFCHNYWHNEIEGSIEFWEWIFNLC